LAAAVMMGGPPKAANAVNVIAVTVVTRESDRDFMTSDRVVR